MPTKTEEDRIWAAALVQARDEHDAEIEDQIRARARRIRNEKLAELRRVEREAAAAKAREAEERELAKGAFKAWRKTFGRRLAGQLDQLGLRARYYPLRDRGEVWLFTDPAAQNAAAELVETFDREARIEADRRPVEGIALVKALRGDRLVAIDPPIEVFEDRVREAEAKRSQALAAKAKAEAERRRKRREVAVFGTELDGPE